MEANKTAATEPHTIEVADGGTGLWPIVVKDACGDPIARFSYGSDAKKFAAHDDLVKALKAARRGLRNHGISDEDCGSALRIVEAALTAAGAA